MNDLVFAGNKMLYLVLIMVTAPVVVATVIGLVIGIVQTVTQLQEQTLPFGLKLLGVGFCLFTLSGWYGELLLQFSRDVIKLALR